MESRQLAMRHRGAVSRWGAEEKIEAAIRRSLPLLPADVRAQFEAMLTPEALGVMAGVLVVWAGSHFFGAGEIVDVILLVAGVAALGTVAFQAGEELVAFAKRAVDARTEADLDQAARHVAHAVSLLGVQTVLAILLKARPKVLRGRSPAISRPPSPRGRMRYRPTVTRVSNKPAGWGATTEWGDIFISSSGSVEAQQLALVHERVHSLLTPKLYFLRNVRVRLGINSYAKSQILRYLEEALAESVAQIGVRGFRNAVSGIAFPVKNGYVTLAGLGTEATGILLGPITAGGMTYKAYYSASKPVWLES